ncbi:hypothetical protein AB4218_00045 [Vibrio splendidus]
MNMLDVEGENSQEPELQKMDKLEIYKRLTYYYRMLSSELGLIEPNVEKVRRYEQEIESLEELTKSDDYYKFCNDCHGVRLHKSNSQCIDCAEAPLVKLNLD